MSSNPFLAMAGIAPQAAPSAPALPRAVRNNNPGNIVADPNNQWQGQTGTDGRFAIFDTPANGDRAHAKVLENYQKLHGINTVRGAITRFAPPSDGNNTEAYIAQVAQTLGVGPDDKIDLADPRINTAIREAQQPIESGIGGQAPVSPARNPFLEMAGGDTQGNAPEGTGTPGGQLPADSGVPVREGGVDGPAGGTGRRLSDYLPSGTDFVAGAQAGLTNVGLGAVHGARWLAQHTIGSDLGISDTDLSMAHDVGQQKAQGNANDPNSWSYLGGQIAGDIAPTLPLLAAKPLQALGMSGKLAQGLARYGDMAAQGGAMGYLGSGGKDPASGAAFGALAAPALGAAADAVLPSVIRAASPVTSKIAAALKKGWGADAPELAAEAPDAVAQTIRRGSEILRPEDIPTGSAPGANLRVDITPAVKPTPQEISAALGSRGARSGVEATTELPPQVAEQVQRLTEQGVPMEQAIREADIAYIGGKPTIAAVTRNPEDQAAIWEGAKQATPEGRALSAQIAQNNAAVHAKIQGLVQDAGGVPSQGEVAQTAAASLAKASDAARARVTSLYTKAAETNGEALVDAAPLAQVFQTTAAKAPVTNEGRAFVSGMRRQIAALTDNGTKKLSASELEQLRQTANDAYDPTASKEVNRLVGQFKDAIDARFDELGAASPAYKAARAAHRKWALAYDGPAGINKLIRRDAQGNFTNSDNWRQAEGFVGSTADKPFVQIVGQLKANGDTETINRLKASVIQRAYERATNNATDKLGNSVVSGKLFFGELNKIGTAKLKALFTPQELADLAATGRAAVAMNEAVPGTVNTSNTASALAKVLQNMDAKPAGKLKVAARVVGHAVGAVTGHLGGNVAVEGVNHAAGKVAAHTSAKKLADALRQSMDPAASRSAAKAEAQRVADVMRRRGAARKVSERSAPLAAALEERRK